MADNAPELSAREFFNQDDAALAPMLFGKPLEEAAEPVEKISVPFPAEHEDDAPAAGVPELAETASGAADETAEASETEAEDEHPTAEGITPVLKDKPITEFQVVDAEGPLQIPDLTFKFKANGQERELRIDQVVRMAQMGFTNEERENQVLAAKKFVTESQSREQAYKELVAEYDARVAAMLEDPDVYENARVGWARSNSAEARAARAETELATTRQSIAQQAAVNTVAGFVKEVLVPSTSRLLEQNPLVTDTELLGRYTQLTAPLLVNGKVPIRLLPEVERIVRTDLTQWVEARQLERTSTRQQAEKKIAKGTQETAEAKRAAARMLAAPGKVGSPNGKQTTFASAREWLDAAF